VPDIASLPARFDLADKLALVIGGSNGIGLEIALGVLKPTEDFTLDEAWP
jgi:hypothetical protein